MDMKLEVFLKTTLVSALFLEMLFKLAWIKLFSFDNRKAIKKSWLCQVFFFHSEIYFTENQMSHLNYFIHPSKHTQCLQVQDFLPSIPEVTEA